MPNVLCRLLAIRPRASLRHALRGDASPRATARLILFASVRGRQRSTGGACARVLDQSPINGQLERGGDAFRA